MALHATWIAAAFASFVSASPAAESERPILDLSLQPGLSLYLGNGLPRLCGEKNGCAAGPSLAAQLGVRVTPMIDVVAGWRHVWSNHPNRLDEPLVGFALWPPAQGIIVPRLYATMGPVLVPNITGFQAQAGAEVMVFPARWLGLGLAGELGLGWLGGWGLGAFHVGAAIHVRL